MDRSVQYWVGLAYNGDPPKVLELADRVLGATDASPADALQDVMRRLARRWQERFDWLSGWLAEHFAKQAAERSDAALKSALRRGGMSVRFTMSPAQRDALRAIVHENVSLIKSIPSQHLQKVEGSVMRSVQAGRDLHSLREDLVHEHGVTRRRANLIAEDQNSKATGALQRVRYMDLDIAEADWMHSHAGREPRWQHVTMHGKRYNVARGMWDPVEKKFIYPGELIRCRCTSRPVIRGFS